MPAPNPRSPHHIGNINTLYTARNRSTSIVPETNTFHRRNLDAGTAGYGKGGIYYGSM